MTSTAAATTTQRIGCVSFLNAKPLVEGLGSERVSVSYDVPSGLLEELERGEVDVALCPVIDYQRSRQPLVIVPSGCIGCEGPTLTVRLFSRVAWGEVTQLHADTDSHTSVVLAQVVLAERWGVKASVKRFEAQHEDAARYDTVLLIGDKVVTQPPPERAGFVHQLDLGQAWQEMTAMPFVFAVWMAQRGRSLGDLPQRMRQLREANEQRITELAERYAPAHGWDTALAQRYLGSLLRYRFTDRHAAALERFFALAHRHGLIDTPRPLVFSSPP